jgi:hypothetical protein
VFSVRYVLNTCRVVQGLARRLRPRLHCKPSRAEQNRTDWAWKTNVRYEMEAFTLHAEPSQTEPDRACSLAQVHKYLQPIRPEQRIIYTLLYTLAHNVFSTITAAFPRRIQNCVTDHLQQQKATHNREVHRPLQNYGYSEVNLRDITVLAPRVWR